VKVLLPCMRQRVVGIKAAASCHDASARV
jgi:hypothetical protein